jgi:hypothetical protein
VVAYCLRITDVDPIDLNLYFERFINPKRTSPPDFDIDYSWKERDEVLDYIPELDSSLSECFRTLKTGKSTVLSFGNESSLHVYFAYSHDYGKSWSESFRVDDDGSSPEFTSRSFSDCPGC